MARVPYERKLLFADGARSLFPRELPKELYLGQSVDSGCHVVLDADDRAENLYVLGVTGVGKTFFLENIVFQNIVTGRPIAVFDPTGGLYTRILDFTAFCLERAEEKGHDVAALQERFLFLNAESASNTQRVNLLEPIGESIEETVDDNLKLFSRLFGSLDEQRRIYQTARGSMWVGVALNQLPEADRPEIPGCPYPLNLHFISVFLTMTNEERERLVRCLPNRNEHAYVRLFWEKFFSGYTQSQRQERIESTFNCLSFLAGNAFAGNVFDTHHTTLNIPELLEHQKSLFVKLSLGRSLKGSQVIAAYLLTKFQRAATRRPLGHRPPYDVVVDEIGEFGDAEFAKALSTTRQFGLHFFVAHQASDQPPFDPAEGRAWLNTMRSNAATKVIF